MERANNISIKSENGQYYIIRNVTPDVSISKTPPTFIKPELNPLPAVVQQRSPRSRSSPMFPMLPMMADRRVYTQLRTVPPPRWVSMWHNWHFARSNTHTHGRAMDFWISREIPSLSKTREDLFFHVKSERCWRVDVAVWIANLSANSELFKFILFTLRHRQDSRVRKSALPFIYDYTMRKTFVTISSEFHSSKGHFNSRSKSSLSPFQFAWAFQHHNTLFLLSQCRLGRNEWKFL